MNYRLSLIHEESSTREPNSAARSFRSQATANVPFQERRRELDPVAVDAWGDGK
jgi:hypothetical protein